MRLKSLAKNMTEVNIAGITVLFSYETPVAAILKDGGIIVTREKFSSTTSRHIRKWVDGREYDFVDQVELASLGGVNVGSFKTMEIPNGNEMP